MTTTPEEPLREDDISTVGGDETSVGAPDADADGTDGTDGDSTDADGTDGTDGDTTDADGTDAGGSV